MAYSADQEASGLTAATTVATTDLFLIQPGGAGDLKKITLANLFGGLPQITVDNLRLDGNTLSSTDTNGNISLAPNGSGYVSVKGFTAGIDAAANNELFLVSNGVPVLEMYGALMATVRSDGGFGISNSAGVGGATVPDVAISRVSAGVLGVGTGAAGSVAGTLRAARVLSGDGTMGAPAITLASAPTGAGIGLTPAGFGLIHSATVYTDMRTSALALRGGGSEPGFSTNPNGTDATLLPDWTDGDTGFRPVSANTFKALNGGVESVRFNTAASAVNYLDITPSATTAPVILAAAGADANIGINLNPKGTGIVDINSHFQWAGQSFLAANATNATTTMAATGLTVTLTTGRKYGFRAVLRFSTDVAADGAKFDFDTGTATVTDFRAFATGGAVTTGDFANISSTALATDFAYSSVDGVAQVTIEGSFEPSGNGTFLIQFAQNAHTTGTLTLLRGSTLTVYDYP